MENSASKKDGEDIEKFLLGLTQFQKRSLTTNRQSSRDRVSLKMLTTKHNVGCFM